MINVSIEFFDKKSELSLPLVRLTKSKNRMTGTATFIFIKPKLFELSRKINQPINQMTLVYGEKKIITDDLTLLFFKGKPFLIKAIFIFTNSSDWFNFLNFMNHYSKEMGLSFTKQKF